MSDVSLLMLHLDDLSIVEGGVLKSPAIIVLSVSPFGSVSTCLMYLGAAILPVYIQFLYSIDELTPLSLHNDLLCLVTVFYFKAILSDVNIAYRPFSLSSLSGTRPLHRVYLNGSHHSLGLFSFFIFFNVFICF